MGYRIDYQPIRKLRGVQHRRSRMAALTGLFVLVFFVAVRAAWPEGRSVLQGVIFSGDAAVTVAAIEDLTQELETGTPIKEALTLFFRQIMEGRCLAPD